MGTPHVSCSCGLCGTPAHPAYHVISTTEGHEGFLNDQSPAEVDGSAAESSEGEISLHTFHGASGQAGRP